MEKIKLGIIGIGNMGSGHTRYLMNGEVPNAYLNAVCDTDPKKLEWVKSNYGDKIQLYDNDDAFFEKADIDAVIIATPHYFHPPLAIQAFNKGLNVLVEKPAGVYTKQVREMNEAAGKSGKVFGIMLMWRTHPLYKKLKDLIESGELGELKRTNWIITDWYRSQSYYDSGTWRATWGGEGGGVLLNQCPHNLDLWQWTCGMPNKVRAFCYYGKYHNIEVEDEVTAYVEYPNGATGIFTTTTAETPGTNRLEVVGTMGRIVVENNTLTFYRLRESERAFNARYKGGFGEPEYWKCDVPINGRPEWHAGITRNFVNAILKGDKLIAPGEDGIRSLSLSNAMHLSSWTDSFVSIPVDEDLYYQKLKDKIKTSKYQAK